jgi:hypothetical protein
LNILQPPDFTASRVHRSRASLAASLFSVVLIAGLVACTADLSPAPALADIEALPSALADSTAPNRPALLIPLDSPPAADTDWTGAFRFRAGRVTAQADILWVPTQRVVVVQPFDPLRPDLQWTLESGENSVRTRDGREVRLGESGFPLTQTAALPIVPDPRPSVSVSGDAIAELLQLRCGSCHADDGVLTPLDLESLFGFSRNLNGLQLVKPFRPEASVLLHRILPDYPLDGAQQTMPPPWSDVPSLSEDEIRQIEAWILLGAPR